MQTPLLVAFLAGCMLVSGAGCSKKPTEASPTPKPAADPAAKACADKKSMEECSTCCTAAFNARFMGGKCDCLER
jgi:hypothetical protein